MIYIKGKIDGPKIPVSKPSKIKVLRSHRGKINADTDRFSQKFDLAPHLDFLGTVIALSLFALSSSNSNQV